MKSEIFIARRYLSTKHKPLFSSFLLFICLLAVTTGVFALIFVLSVMNGFEHDFQKRILGFKAPIVVSSQSGEDLSARIKILSQMDSHIQRVSAFIEGEAVIQSESGANLGIRIRGISEAPTKERLGELYESEPFSAKGILLGEELASSLRVHPDFFEKIRLIFPFGEIGPSGDFIPRVHSLTLSGVFRSGFYDYDSKYALVDYDEASRLFGGEGRTGLEVWVEPFESVEVVKHVLEQKIGSSDIVVQTWRDQNPKLFSAMKLEKIGMFLLLSMLLVIASFNIFGLTSLSVLDKAKDMAILRSVGLTAKKVRRIFLAEAAGIGLVGAFLGGTAGIVTSWLLQRYPIRLPSSYYLQHLPVRMDPKEVLFVMTLAPVLTALSAFYPAWQASRKQPVEVLRYE